VAGQGWRGGPVRPDAGGGAQALGRRDFQDPARARGHRDRRLVPGGIASLWIGLTYPDVFGKIAGLSTSANWDNRQIVRFVAELPGKTEARIWTDIGTAEGSRLVEGSRLLHDALVAKGWEEGRDVIFVEAEGEPHNEVAWSKRMPAILEFLFPPRPEMPDEVDG
jgi:enterochelin esterase-like enzyme